MTSRVQKGGAVFKPSIKVRARTAAPSAETKSKNPENGLSEPSAPSISAAPSASTSSIPQPQAPFFRDPSESISTATTIRSVHPARSTALPPSISTSVTPKPPFIARTIPSTSFSSFNRLGPPSVPIAPTSNPPPVSTINAPNSSATTSFTGSNTVSLSSQQPATFPVAEGDAQDAFSTQFGRDGFSLEFLGSHDAFLSSLADSSIESGPMSLTAPGLSAIDPQLQPILPGNLVLHNSASDNVPPITSGAETDSKSKKRGRSKKVTEEDQQETEDGDGVKPTRKSSRRGKKTATGQDGQKPTRKRKSSQAANDDSGSDAETPPPAKKRKRSSGSQTPRPRKKRTPSLPPYDPDADPGEEIDPTVVTMAFLCEDPGFGRVSSKALEIQSNHAAWKARNKEKRAKLRRLMEKKKYGLDENESDGEEAAVPPAPTKEPPPNEDAPASPAASGSNPADETGNGFDYSQDLTTSRYNVQVRIGPNGETIIDETSLTVDRDENHATENYTHIVESDTSKFTNSGTYGKRFRGSRWSADETELFYDALAQYGENYELIAFVLPGRDRKSCKNKFKAEDKKNPQRINFVLNNSKPVDMDTLSRMTGKDFSGPVPEIVAPPVPVIVTPSAPEPDAPPEIVLPVRKRSQSRHRALADDVQIVGQVDDFVDPDDLSI